MDSTSDLQFLGWYFPVLQTSRTKAVLSSAVAHVHAIPDISYRGQARAGMCCRS